MRRDRSQGWISGECDVPGSVGSVSIGDGGSLGQHKAVLVPSPTLTTFYIISEWTDPMTDCWHSLFP